MRRCELVQGQPAFSVGTDVGFMKQICEYGTRTPSGARAIALIIKEIYSAKPTDKPYKLADSGGLCLLVPPSGAKLWRWQYRFGGKEKMMALGEYPLVSLKEARERQAEVRNTITGPDEVTHCSRVASIEGKETKE